MMNTRQCGASSMTSTGAQVSVGRLGIILDLTFKIVPNLSVRRERKDVDFNEFVDSLKEVQQQYKGLLAKGGSVDDYWNVSHACTRACM